MAFTKVWKEQIVKPQTRLGIWKPKQELQPREEEDDDECCDKFKAEVMNWLNLWTIPEYLGHLESDEYDCEIVYDGMNRFIIPDAKVNNNSGYKIITENQEPNDNTNYHEVDHPKLKQAQKEIEDIKERWDRECKKDKEYRKIGAAWWRKEW